MSLEERIEGIKTSFPAIEQLEVINRQDNKLLSKKNTFEAPETLKALTKGPLDTESLYVSMKGENYFLNASQKYLFLLKYNDEVPTNVILLEHSVRDLGKELDVEN